MKKKSFLIVVLSFGLTMNIYADIIGVSDAAMLSKALEQLSVLYKQLETMNKTYSTATEQFNTTKNMLTKAEAQLKSIDNLVNKNSGHYGFGGLQNSISDLKNQQWSADTWQDSLNGNGGFNKIQYENLVDTYHKNYNILSSDEFQKGASVQAKKDYEQTVKVNQAAGVQSEYAFNEINSSLKRIHDLSLQIEKADNTKAAVDLNSRLLTEVAYLQTQNLKSQSLVNQQLVHKQALEISERGHVSQLLAFDDNY